MLNGKLRCKFWASHILLLLLAASNAYAETTKESQSTKAQEIEVKASDTAKLKELLENQKVDASFIDGTSLKAKVKEVRDGLIAVKVERSEGQNALTKGEHSIPTDKLAIIKIAKYKGSKRTILSTILGLAGLGLGWVIVSTEFAGESINSTYAGVFAATIVSGAIAGYAWGRKLDKKEVTVIIR
jgi:hypothetical protein